MFRRSGYWRVYVADAPYSQHTEIDKAFAAAIEAQAEHRDEQISIQPPDYFVERDMALRIIGAPPPGRAGMLDMHTILSLLTPWQIVTDNPNGSYTFNRWVSSQAAGGGSGTSELNAWTPAEAMAQAQPGDVVCWLPDGPYSLPAQNGRFVPAFNPENNGTAANPIIHAALNPAAFLADDSPDRTIMMHSGGTGPVIGAARNAGGQRQYITWDGFFVDEADAPPASDTGPAVMYGAENCHFKRNRLIGINPGWQDNHCGIRIEETFDCQSLSNKISGFRTNNNHGCGILAYASRGYRWAFNEVFDGEGGIQPKGDGYTGQYFMQNPGWIHNNYVHGCIDPLVTGQIKDVAGDMSLLLVYLNLFDGAEAQGIGQPTYDPQTPRYIVYANNTWANCSRDRTADAVIYGGGVATLQDQVWTGIVHVNNIYHTRESTPFMLSYSLPFGLQDRLDVNRNGYIGLNESMWLYLNGGQQSYAQWRAAGRDANSVIATTAAFRNYAGGDFQLASGSPLAGIGRDYLGIVTGTEDAVIDAGCYAGAEPPGLKLAV